MKHKFKLCVVAVDVRSAHNIGSIFRTCDGFGAELYLVGICPRPSSSNDERLPHIVKKADKDISKTALGAEKTVIWRHAKTLKECSRILKKEGFKIAAIEQAPKSKKLNNIKITQNTAIVLGREVQGLNKDELKLCDELYEIEMNGVKESFNVSVACGIALYQCVS